VYEWMRFAIGKCRVLDETHLKGMFVIINSHGL
jgi:hypothetical protein